MATLLRYNGIVQGVGFRPNVWRIANALSLDGDVCNDGLGVLVRLWASDHQVNQFRQQLESVPPPLAIIEEISIEQSDIPLPCNGFTIIQSKETLPLTGITPDAATCSNCCQEILDKKNRRFRYPFTNCTNCGPRLSIIKAIPYDRKNTSMEVFKQCLCCLKEYQDPSDRRYHAQPNACPECGPKVWLEGLNLETDEDCISATIRLIKQGKILAIKGIGGFHLVCDATNVETVARLRQRKKRFAKPFALMARDVSVINNYCSLSNVEIKLLESSASPIILLQKHQQENNLVEDISPESSTLGFMLPYSPLHSLIMAEFETPLIMTSGNSSEEPQCIDNDDAKNRLQNIADYTLLHNREIINRVDDSVVKIIASKPRLIRRARGYAPVPIQLHATFKKLNKVMALGGELKNTICLLQQGKAIVSQHFGDLEDAMTNDEFEKNVHLYQQLYQFKPHAIAVDQHSGYRSNRFGRELSKQSKIPLNTIQHHHAHIASVLAESQWPVNEEQVLGLSFDGLGLGDDGDLWGGEFMLANYSHYQRLGSLTNVPMPGAHQAIIEPWRNCWAQLQNYFNWQQIEKSWGELDLIEYLNSKPLASLQKMIEQNINSPYTSSAGRLFDAVGAALRLHSDSIQYEGQTAIALENLALQSQDKTAYPFELIFKNKHWSISAKPMWTSLLDDLHNKQNKADIAMRFHMGFAKITIELVNTLQKQYPFDTIALSGGVFQNSILLEALLSTLQQDYTVLHHTKVPTNDGGLSLGQAAIAAVQSTNCET